MEIWRVAAVSCPEATPRRRHPTQLIGDRFGSAPPQPRYTGPQTVYPVESARESRQESCRES